MYTFIVVICFLTTLVALAWIVVFFLSAYFTDKYERKYGNLIDKLQKELLEARASKESPVGEFKIINSEGVVTKNTLGECIEYIYQYGSDANTIQRGSAILFTIGRYYWTYRKQIDLKITKAGEKNE